MSKSKIGVAKLVLCPGGVLHSGEATFQNLLEYIRDMSKQAFEKNSSFFLLKGPPGGIGGLNYSFCTLSKMCYKTRNPYSISLKLDTNKKNSCIKFCMNLIMFTMPLMIFRVKTF